MRAFESTDRALIDLRDQRTDIAIRISLLTDSAAPTKSSSLGCSAIWS